jgi:hypothetical protein
MTATDDQDPPLPATLEAFVESVVDGEDGSGSVFLAKEAAGDASVLACWNGEDIAAGPDYPSAVEATPVAWANAIHLLEEAGLDVYTDANEWAEECDHWRRLA